MPPIAGDCSPRSQDLPWKGSFGDFYVQKSEVKCGDMVEPNLLKKTERRKIVVPLWFFSLYQYPMLLSIS